MKNVLLIAYHFPPLLGSSGLLRTLKHVYYLEKYGFKPTVLTVKTRAYERLNYSLLAQVPSSVQIHRAFALDTRRHLSFKGRYFEFLSIPDRYTSWIPFGIVEGCRIVVSKKIDIIYTTYPIGSALAIGNSVAYLTKRPLVVDFRDPMYDQFSKFSRNVFRAKKVIEESAVKNSAHVIVTTPGTRELFAERYPHLSPDKITIIPNGFDEQDFLNIDVIHKKRNGIRMIHTGLLDPVDRDPLPFFRALHILKSNNVLKRFNLKIELFAPGNEKCYEDHVKKLDINDRVEIKPSISYSEILTEMFNSDILLLFQGPTCDHQIPAKIYEYLRVGKPVLAFTSRDGDTGRLISSYNAGLIISENDPIQIASKCEKWIHEVAHGNFRPSNSPGTCQEFSREKQTENLAKVFSHTLREMGRLE